MNKLLAIEPGGDEEADAEVQQSFKQFLQDFIRRNALKHALLVEMNTIMVNVQVEQSATCRFRLFPAKGIQLSYMYMGYPCFQAPPTGKPAPAHAVDRA